MDSKPGIIKQNDVDVCFFADSLVQIRRSTRLSGEVDPPPEITFVRKIRKCSSLSSVKGTKPIPAEPQSRPRTRSSVKLSLVTNVKTH